MENIDMKKRVFIIIMLACLVNLSFAASKIINPLTDKEDFIYKEMKVWNIPDIKILGGDQINDGLSITIDFSTKAIVDNAEIFMVGASVNNTLEKAFSMNEMGNQLAFVRIVKLGDKIREFISESWTKNILNPFKNYTLKFEIDETRCKYSIWQIGQPSSKVVEYSFYGLNSSFVKQLLSSEGKTLCIGIANNFDVRRVVVVTLGHGIGVAVPPIKTSVSIGRIKNQNSGKILGLYHSTIAHDNIIVQHNEAPGYTTDWKIIPEYQGSRKPTSYNLKLLNMSSNLGVGINHCSLDNGTPLINTDNETCNIWQFNRELSRESGFRLINKYNSTFAVVKDASLEDDAMVVEWESAETKNSFWTFEPRYFHSSIESGCYTIKNKNSSMFLQSAVSSFQGVNTVQYPESNLGDRFWYIQKDEFGLYTITNIDSKKKLAVENASLTDFAPIILENETGRGNEKWIIEKLPHSNHYTFRSLHSDKYIVVADASKEAGAGIIQHSTGTDNKLWELTPAPIYPTKDAPGGLFKIHNTYTSLYLVVENASTQEGARLISWKTGDTPNAWWSFEKLEDGGYAIKNAGSQLYLVIKDAAMERYASAIQYRRDALNEYGNSIWILEYDQERPQYDLFWLKNLHSGKYLYFEKEDYVDGTQAVQDDTDGLLKMKYRWQLIPITD